MNQSALQNHYDFSECENGYTFFTHSGNQYFVFFIEYPLFEEAPYTHVYSVTIERVDEENHNTGEEHELRNTIIHILDLFFRQHQNALISVCDTEGERQSARHRLILTITPKFYAYETSNHTQRMGHARREYTREVSVPES